MITDEDIIKIKTAFEETFATKQDILSIKKEISNNKTEIEIIAKTTAFILENMATKKDISDVKTEIHDLRMDLKIFKKDTEHSIKEIKNDFADMNDTGMIQDRRIEKLEGKVFA